ncbi:tyrosine-protein phosphatase [Aliiroseovarius sp. 2305UL8-7]|uniref:tyrosine-protein phosphatase n=1 Tax=Aliiroseovarius conchicola TaxID=3121637 RepID=UPI003529CE04
MFSKLHARIKQTERNWKRSFGTDISTPEGRQAARRHNNLVDHAFLRRILPNRYKLSDEAWRSNQPDPVHFPKLADIGIKSVINLRGEDTYSYYLFEKEACADYGMTLYDHELFARVLGSKEDYLHLLDLMETVEKPMLIHCKSGADRTGIAAALYLLDQKGADLDAARAQLSLKYAHQRWSKAGILDHLLETYADHFEDDPISVRDWLTNHYDPEAITASFHAKRSKG